MGALKDGSEGVVENSFHDPILGESLEQLNQLEYRVNFFVLAANASVTHPLEWGHYTIVIPETYLECIIDHNYTEDELILRFFMEPTPLPVAVNPSRRATG